MRAVGLICFDPAVTVRGLSEGPPWRAFEPPTWKLKKLFSAPPYAYTSPECEWSLLGTADVCNKLMLQIPTMLSP